MAAGAVSLKLPNFLTTSQDVTKAADQANYHYTRYTGPIFSGLFIHQDTLQSYNRYIYVFGISF